ncbi:hypothetical protein HDZ31DRAFT_34934 [Schizophyllum fasciatum]
MSVTNAWPADARAEGSRAQDAKGKKKQGRHVENYPNLVPGLLSSATLVEGADGRLEWTSVTGAMNKRKRPRVVAGTSQILYPPTRAPELSVPHTTIQQKAEEGANFLRTFLPDVDVTAELIREEITHDEELARETHAFDPLAGNVLAPVVCYDSSAHATANLAFPTGELGSDLNISPYTANPGEGPIFKPIARPARTFSTPIQQVVTHAPTRGAGNSATFLAVRTLGATYVSEMRELHSPTTPQLADRLTLKRARTGGKYLVDVGFQDPGPTFVGLPHETSGRTKVVPSLDASAQNDGFWRLGVGQAGPTFLLASSSAVRRIDPRADNTPSPIFSLARPPERLTAIENDPSEHTIRLCTTSQLLWLDSRFTGRPLLSYAHGRQYDPALQLHTARMRGAPLSFLSSPRNGLVTVYDVSRADGDLVYAHIAPYALPTVRPTPFVGQAFFRHPSAGEEGAISCLRLDARGGLTCSDICCAERDGEHAGQDEQPPRTGLQWSDEVKALAAAVEAAEPDAGPLGAQDKVEMNLRPAYDRLFRQYEDERRVAQEQDTESVYDLLDNAPRYWQQADEHPDHMLTTYDVLFRSGDEPKNPSRADFLTQSAINSLRGYRALVQERIPLEDIQKGAKWHADLAPSLAKLDGDFEATNPDELHERLRRFDLAGGYDEGADDVGPAEEQRTAASLRREAEARQQLTLDLALSRHVFSARPFVPEPDASNELEAMTEALSLAAEPPPVHFSYLTPIRRDHYAADTDEQPLALPPGPRLLLSEWPLGEDPAEYVFHDAYDADAAERPPPVARRKKAVTTTADAGQPGTSQGRAPPSIVPASTLTSGLLGAELQRAQPPPVVASQPPAVVPPFPASQPPARRALAQAGSLPAADFSQSQSGSQGFMPSTQVLPGPFGGRPAPKKKPAKKRVGGF